MKYLSVCSGIEAATVAWHELGWEPIAFAEVDKFPSRVLAHHYPDVPNLGDMTKFKEWPDATFDVLVGGTPCQSFSVAGLRKGMDDPRGNLALTYLAIADRYRPQWIVWENVPGVLSSNGGRDFGSFVGALGKLGYGWAYRVLDAQYFGVAQRRRRVFVVGCLGDWRAAAAVLFESPSLRRDTPPSRETGKVAPAGPAAGAGSGGAHAFKVRGGVEREDGSRGSQNIGKQAGKGYRGSDELAFTVASSPDQWLCQQQQAIAARMVAFGEYVEDGTASAMKARDYKDATDLVAQPIGFNTRQDPDAWQGRTGPVDTHNGTQGVMQPVAIGLDEEQNARIDGFGTLKARMEGGGFEGSVMTPAMQVRRLTPVECERLQGFQDNHTNIPWRGKAEAPDGPRYKALGNSMAVPVMRWIGERINA